MGEAENAQRIWGELVSGNYFDLLGVKPLLGRVFLPEECGDKPGAYPLAVISERLWRSRFGADPAVVGSSVLVNRRQLTIVGVVPAEFQGTQPGVANEIWIPVMMSPQLTGIGQDMVSSGSRNYRTTARLKPGVTVEQAREEVAAIARRQAEIHPEKDEGLGATMVPVWQAHTGAQSILLRPLQILMAVSFVVLLIVCANVANLLLARSIARQKECSIRFALGAGRARLTRQLLTETLLLTGMGALLGLPLALSLKHSLVWLLPPVTAPLGLDFRLNPDILGFTILICLAAALVSSLVPVLHALRPDLNETLKEGGRSGTSTAHSHRLRGLLVISEVALALVALIGAGLFAASFQATRSLDPGFDPQDVSVAQFSPKMSGYSAEQAQQFCLRLRQRLQSAPGMVDLSYAIMLPLGFGLSTYHEIEVEGYVRGRTDDLNIYYNTVSPGFFSLLRIPLLAGRDFTEQDDLNALPVIIVNEYFTRRFFASRNPIGRKVKFGGQSLTVAGVVKDTKYHNLAEAPLPYIYMPFRQALENDRDIDLYLRSAGHSGHALATLRREAAALDPHVGVFDVMPLSEYMGESLFPQKVAASLLSVLGALSLLLAALGLYSVMAYAVSQRTREIGIRMALGAQRGNVLGMVLRQGMLLTLAGLLAGAAPALALTRLVASMLVKVSATDPLIFAASALFLAAVALLATYLPARRATNVDPMVALRHQ